MYSLTASVGARRERFLSTLPLKMTVKLWLLFDRTLGVSAYPKLKKEQF